MFPDTQERWREGKLGNLCSLLNGCAFKPEDWSTIGRPIVRIQNLNGSEDFNYFNGVISPRYEIPPGTLLFSWSGNRGPSFGPYIWRGDTGLLNQHIFKVTPGDDIDPGWFYYALDEIRQRVERDAHGAIGLVHVKRGDLCNYKIHLPPQDEQRRIAEILGAVDEAIGQTEALVAKLKKIKAGLLHDLLTRGINENGELREPQRHPEHFKDSALGRVPKDWSVQEAGFICDEIVVGIVIRPAQYYTESGVPVLRSANVREDGIEDTDLVFMSEASNRLLSKSMLQAGNVVTVRTGYPGTTAVISPEFDGCNCVDLIISRPKPTVRPHFLAFWVNSDFGKGQVLRKQGGLAQQHFNVREMQRLLVALPSPDEQRELEIRLQSCAERIQMEEAYVGKLGLLKVGLMHDLLTGTVRVTSLEAVP